MDNIEDLAARRRPAQRSRQSGETEADIESYFDRVIALHAGMVAALNANSARIEQLAFALTAMQAQISVIALGQKLLLERLLPTVPPKQGG